MCYRTALPTMGNNTNNATEGYHKILKHQYLFDKRIMVTELVEIMSYEVFPHFLADLEEKQKLYCRGYKYVKC